MIEVSRIVEVQSKAPLKKVTDTEAEYDFLEGLIDNSKPSPPTPTGHHYLIFTSFRYPPPIPPGAAARFRPAYYHRNCTYVSERLTTSIFEYVYHWLDERIGKTGLSNEAQLRTGLFLGFDSAGHLDISKRKES